MDIAQVCVNVCEFVKGLYEIDIRTFTKLENYMTNDCGIYRELVEI